MSHPIVFHVSPPRVDELCPSHTTCPAGTENSVRIRTSRPPNRDTGGSTHDASVYFTSGPASAPAASSAGADATSACNANVSVNPVTSCPFAANVFQDYAAQYHANPQPVETVRAYSPVTHLTYNMTCVSDGTTVNCTGGKGSFLTFPLHAAQKY